MYTDLLPTHLIHSLYVLPFIISYLAILFDDLFFWHSCEGEFDFIALFAVDFLCIVTLTDRPEDGLQVKPKLVAIRIIL